MSLCISCCLLEAPYCNIYTKHEVELGVDNVLICRVSGFYPAPVHISWTRNNLNLTSNISSSVPRIKEDRTFYQFSSLKFTPEQGDVYSCRVNHQSLTEPLARVWGKAVVCSRAFEPIQNGYTLLRIIILCFNY